MKNLISSLGLVLLFFTFNGISGSTFAEEARPATNLIGVWEGKRIFGPELKGQLVLTKNDQNYFAEIGPYKIKGSESKDLVLFEFPQGLGALRARLSDGTLTGEGHWVQPGNVANGNRFASPVALKPLKENVWQGWVVPLQDQFTVYFVVQEKEDGTTEGFIKNPDRNVGVFVELTRIEQEEETVKVFGTFRGGGEEQLLLTGTYEAEEDRLSLFLSFTGATFDFSRVGENSTYYARGKNPEAYTYAPPTPTDDGWEVGSLEEAGIALGPLKEMIEKEVFPAPEDVHSHDLHGILIARGGKLVMEEYFQGFNRDLPHDTRSASKSLTATLFGAAVEAGFIEGADVPVYETILGDKIPADMENRKGTMTAHHLLTQTSGFYCDDSDNDAPGNENIMQNQEEEPDWYKYTLALPMAYNPGEKAIYCSANSNLIGNVLSATSGKPLEVLFHELIAEPLGIKRYHLNLQPNGAPYMGGGIYWLPREFMKLGQLYLDGGVWNGQRILSEDWAKAATSAQVQIGERGYGYQWWVQEFSYKDRTVTVFYAGGNGGQVVAVVPELDLVVAFYGGNYSDRILFKSQNVLFPDYILRAVAEGESN